MYLLSLRCHNSLKLTSRIWFVAKVPPRVSRLLFILFKRRRWKTGTSLLSLRHLSSYFDFFSDMRHHWYLILTLFSTVFNRFFCFSHHTYYKPCRLCRFFWTSFSERIIIHSIEAFRALPKPVACLTVSVSSLDRNYFLDLCIEYQKLFGEWYVNRDCYPISTLPPILEARNEIVKLLTW